MSSQALAKIKTQDSTTFSPVFGKKLSDQTFASEQDNEARNVSNPEFGHNFGDVKVESNQSFKQNCSSIIQTKLKIGQPNDKYEQEADKVAEQVMRMPDPLSQVSEQVSVKAQTGHVQKKCVKCEEGDEEQIQRKPLVSKTTPMIQRQTEEDDDEKDEEEEEGVIQTKQDKGQSNRANPEVTANIQFLHGSGQPLPESTRAYFESRFDHNFSNVRVHNDALSSKSARSINAKAYTIGSDIVFGTGHYAPEKSDGRELLAHELTHVIQQRRMPSVSVKAQRKSAKCEEEEKEQIQRKPIISKITPMIQRQTEEDEKEKEDEEDIVQTKQDTGQSNRLTAGFFTNNKLPQGGGRPLSESTRAFFEPRFGLSFSSVRVHTDTKATNSAKDINARAFTLGNDIVFGNGQYAPNSIKGKKLLAHELAHTIQQKSNLIKSKSIIQRRVTKKYANECKSEFIYKFIGQIKKTKKGKAVLYSGDPSRSLKFVKVININAKLFVGQGFFAHNGPIETHKAVCYKSGPKTWKIGWMLSNDVEKADDNTQKASKSKKIADPGYYKVKLSEKVFLRKNKNSSDYVMSGSNKIYMYKNQTVKVVGGSGHWIKVQGSAAPGNLQLQQGWIRINSTNLGKKDFTTAEIQWLRPLAMPHLLSELRKKMTHPDLKRLWKHKNQNNDRLRLAIDVMLQVNHGAGHKLPKFITNVENRMKKLRLPDDQQLAIMAVLRQAQLRSAKTKLTPQQIKALRGRFKVKPNAIGMQGGLVSGSLVAIAGIQVAQVTKSGIAISQALVDYIKANISKVRGYKLLTVILGRDPITGEDVKQNADNLIGGFLNLTLPSKLAEKYSKLLKESKVITKTFNWLKAKLIKVKLTWNNIKDLIKDAWDSLSEADLLNPLTVYKKIFNVISKILGRIIEFAKAVGKKIGELIIKGFMGLVSKGGNTKIVKDLMKVLKRAGDVFKSIIDNPKKFIDNLMTAVKGGINKFLGNIKKHALGAVFSWLFGNLDEPVDLPKKYDERGIIDVVLQVLKLKKEFFLSRLEKKIGTKKYSILVTGFDLVKNIMTKGISAVWKDLLAKTKNLMDDLISGMKEKVIGFILKKLIAIVAKLAVPGGQILMAIEKIYNFLKTLYKNYQKLLNFINTILGSIERVAKGNISGASKFVVQTMAKGLSLLLTFVAGLLKLGGIPKKVKEAIDKIRESIENGIDAVIDWIHKNINKIVGKAKKAVRAIINWWKIEQPFSIKKAGKTEPHKIYFKGEGSQATLWVASEDKTYKAFIGSLKIPQDNTIMATAQSKAKTIAKKIDNEKKKRVKGATPEKTKENEKNKALAINGLLMELLPHTKMLFGYSELPQSDNPKYKAGNPFAMGTIITKLTSRPPKAGKGSRPTQKPQSEYDKLNNRKKGVKYSFYYVRGHLLNEKMHGKGTWDNMVPLSTKGNSNHEKQVESKVKHAVDSGAVVYYSVKPSSDTWKDNEATLLKQIEKNSVNNEEKRVKKEIVKNEKYVPKKLVCEAKITADSPSKWPGLKVDVDNPVERSYDKYIVKD